jgi:hypothetical protein
VFTTGTDVRIDFRYKHCRIKQYLKDGRALRVETVINNPSDLDVPRRLEHLPELVDKARQVNHRLLIIERAGQSCAIGSALFERLHLPYDGEGQRTGALRFGDTRAMAWPARSATSSTPSPALPTRPSARWSPPTSTTTTTAPAG